MNRYQDIFLSDIVYYRIGGKANLVLEVKTVEDVREALRYFHEHTITDFLILGLGANLLLPDHDLPAVLWIHNGQEQIKRIGENKVWAFAGELLDEVTKFSFANNLTGLGWAGGLPSSVGGAVRGNAGCFGSEIRDVVSSVDVIDLSDPHERLQTVTKDACLFGYRDSFFKQNKQLLIVSATVQLNAATLEELEKDEETYHKNIAYRMSHHPIEYPSCGSVFKNIVRRSDVERILSVWPDIADMSVKKWYGKVSMAYVIGRLGFAGFSVGGAVVSPKHNNYISNVDKAKSADVMQIIAGIQNKFTETFHFSPELEAEMIT